MSEPTAAERATAYLMALVQFVNILDFMMVNPLGPDFAAELHVPSSKLPLIVGSYTFSACIAGVLGSLFLERFDRRRALLTCMLGLAAATALGGFSVDLTTLVGARLLAGAFGGPATSLAFAIIADGVASERRGWAMGIVMGGFAIASVLGVPAGLKLAEWGSWRLPFFGVGALTLLATLAAAIRLPKPPRDTVKPHEAHPLRAIGTMLNRRLVRQSLLMTVLAMTSGFIIIPSLASFLQFNAGFPRARLDQLYLMGGVASLVTNRIAGTMVDRFGSTKVAWIGTLGFVAVLSTFLPDEPTGPVPLFFVGFFISMGLRNVAYNTLTTKVPLPTERAKFLSIQSAVSHGASSLGAALSAVILRERADQSLVHMNWVAIIAAGLALSMPIAMAAIERRVIAEELSKEPSRTG